MLTGFSLALVNYVAGQQQLFPAGQVSLFPGFMASHAVHVICWISLFSALASVIATLLTAPVDAAQLRRFVSKTRPMGFWSDFSSEYAPERGFAESLLYFVLGGVSIYAGMFGVGYLLRLDYTTGSVLLMVCAFSLVVMVRGMSRIDREIRPI
jgi:hypothetical protein